ncbi:F-box/kelch-repeat protein At3g23880-like [Mercurialis annua]|uniref:F-box/kelch-repeat protein At3g23880-like n=1 Tax=Mercurialis annua TaxID=3986 RepID=UPI00215FA94A|nr:F-box/kelch-repeat protein At3g23880-like [Mercurialis annua]
MLSQINQELLTEILKRLPPKLLIQFKSVSKSWRSLITNPIFISIHTKHILENTTNKTSILRHYSWSNKKEIYTIQESNQELGFPFKSYSRFFDVIGSCNGVLCLSDTYHVFNHKIILWNPTIRKYVIVPVPCISSDQIFMFVLGFGFDPKSNEYKLVRIVYRMSNNGRNVDIRPRVEVYELSKNAWRSSNSLTAPKYVISELSLQVFLNGAVHWIGYNPRQAGSDFRDPGVVLFDLSKEMFEEMMLPDSLRGLSVLDLSILAYGKLLSLVEYTRNSPSQWMRYGSCSIWVMKEYGNVESWSKQFTIDLQAGVGKLLGIKNDEVMLMVESDGELVSYDSKNQSINHIGTKGIVKSFRLEAYVETLELLEFNSRTEK